LQISKEFNIVFLAHSSLCSLHTAKDSGGPQMFSGLSQFQK